jgi:DNA (cytosine-5)-methyltransferase 1
MNELALFAGAGGGILGGILSGFTTICAVEIDPYCQAVLLQRQKDGFLPAFPIWDDVRTFNGRPWRGTVDIITGGFPCQDISVAGKGAGITGERSGLWNEFARIIGEARPAYVFIENSPMLRTRGLEVVLEDLAEMGYDAVWGIIGADDARAPHHRKRIWILAYPKSERALRKTGNICQQDGGQINELQGKSVSTSDVSNTSSKRLSEPTFAELGGFQEEDEPFEGSEPRGANSTRRNYWSTEPAIRRVVNGFPSRVDRLKALGNAQVPEVARMAWEILSKRIGPSDGYAISKGE